jgi:hypothetical protein
MHNFIAGLYGLSAKDINLPDSTKNVGQGFTNATAIIMSIVGLTSIVFIIVGGLQLALSAGDSKRVETGRKTLTMAIVGLGVAIGAYAIVSFITTKVQ